MVTRVRSVAPVPPPRRTRASRAPAVVRRRPLARVPVHASPPPGSGGRASASSDEGALRRVARRADDRAATGRGARVRRRPAAPRPRAVDRLVHPGVLVERVTLPASGVLEQQVGAARLGLVRQPGVHASPGEPATLTRPVLPHRGLQRLIVASSTFMGLCPMTALGYRDGMSTAYERPGGPARSNEPARRWSPRPATWSPAEAQHLPSRRPPPRPRCRVRRPARFPHASRPSSGGAPGDRARPIPTSPTTYPEAECSVPTVSVIVDRAAAAPMLGFPGPGPVERCAAADAGPSGRPVR